MSSIKKNISYNLIYRIIVTIIPLIISPYISRVLGPTNVGIFSYTNSIAYYFFLASMLGVNNYGNREIAKVRDDKNKLSETFWQIYYMQMFLSVIMTLIYILGVICVGSEFLSISLLQALYVLSAVTDINWFAFGLEKFKLTTIRSSILKIATAGSIFLLVKNESDLWIYTIILQLGNIISLLVIWPLVRQYTTFQKPNVSVIKKHIKPNLILFLPLVASSLYHYMDRIMIGLYAMKDEVGFYSYAENILFIPFQLAAAIGTVMLPYVSYMVVSSRKEKIVKNLEMFLKYVYWINIGIAFGMAGVAKIFIPWFLGANYSRVVDLFLIIVPVVVVNGIADCLRSQYLIPYKRDGLFTVSICVGAGINLIVNLLLIPRFFGIGASIATIVDYIVQLLIQIVMTRKEIHYKKILFEIIPFVLIGFVMYKIILQISLSISLPTISLLTLQIAFGILVYLGISICWIIFFQRDENFVKIFKMKPFKNKGLQK